MTSPKSFALARVSGIALALLGAGIAAPAAYAQTAGSAVDGSQPASFAGKIGPSRDESTPAWPAQPTAPKGAPNVLIVLLDDAGFAATSAFGGASRTPNIERYAAEGLRYNRFNTTAICSPTRAALLTGRNQHQVGFGNLQDVAAGFPGYNTIWNPQTASIARVLQLNGYSTAAFGKWHNTPKWEISAAGPFNHWPTGLGFDHFYGFMAGDDNQWEPHLYNDTTQIANPGTPETGYHLTTDLVNKAVGWVDDHDAVAPGKPYFLYLATGAVHMPHHVAQEWIDKNKGRFDEGWDKYRELAFARQKKLGVVPADAKLTPRPAGLPAWDSLKPEEKQLYAHEMEVFSAYLEQTDFEVGRLIDTLRKRPGGDNLLVFYILGDNGGSAEGDLEGSISNEAANLVGAPHDFATVNAKIDALGGPELANHYSAGWAWATTTPFQWMKQVASHFGGTRNPLIVDWPGHTSDSKRVRGQFGHVNDIAPTILDAAGIALPATVDGVRQIPFEGKSLVPTFTNAAAPETHTEQYFEIFGNRAIYKDGWVAAAKRSYNPWELTSGLLKVYQDDTATDRWELYNVANDFSEARDLAASNPAKLEELKAEFAREGKRNGVFPLLPLPFGAPSQVDPGKTDFTWQSDVTGLPLSALPTLAGRPHNLTVRIEGKGNAANGVLLAEGGRLGGFVLYAKDGKLSFENNAFNLSHETIAAPDLLPDGPVTVGYSFTPSGSAGGFPGLVAKLTDGVVRLLVNGQVVAQGNVSRFPSSAGSFSEGFDIGQDRGSKVSKDPIASSPINQQLGETKLHVGA
ncbi:sulfatase [Novosphingobium sp. Rr 2-17]|uniref:arylsulfatase n=1 Tax=Novosphingobium sp. Rr 2-17 TaxID=555793 RepID=UPI0002698C03|nr:arylsulfatase [Novosphingobium sp. Rr 2-17]EIZ78145.1 sulfatase [Novosphingobium sp. Rr 2-17]